MIHEFGVPEKNIPRRSFIRVPIENNIKEITKLIENNHKLVSENAMSATVALDRIGIKAQNTIKKSFRKTISFDDSCTKSFISLRLFINIS